MSLRSRHNLLATSKSAEIGGSKLGRHLNRKQQCYRAESARGDNDRQINQEINEPNKERGGDAQLRRELFSNPPAAKKH